LDIGHDGIYFGKEKRTKLVLSGGISNILNTHYINSVTINATAYRYYEPAPDRSFFLIPINQNGKKIRCKLFIYKTKPSTPTPPFRKYPS